MTNKEAITNLLQRYGAAVQKKDIEKLMDKGTKQGFPVKTVFNLLRLILGVCYGKREHFSDKESAELLEISESELFKEMWLQGIKTEQGTSAGTIFLFPKGIS